MARARILSSALLAALAPGLIGIVGPAARANETVAVCDTYGNHVVPTPAPVSGFGVASNCPGDPTKTAPPGGMAAWAILGGTVKKGQAIRWLVRAPQGLTISSVYIPHMYSNGINDNTGYGGGFYWAGGSGGVPTFDGETSWSSAFTGSPHFTWPASGSPYFGWQITCGSASCTAGLAPSHQLSIELLELNMRETVAPTVSGSGQLWAADGWIRGDWPLGVTGDSPAGVCDIAVTLGGQAVAGGNFTFAHNSAYWHECGSATGASPVGGASSAGPVVVHTSDASYPQGATTLALAAVDAAGEHVSSTKTVYVDNQPVTLSLSGPTDAPSTAGAQFITAIAAAGPSGVAGIACSLDGAPYGFHPGAGVQIPVLGVGVHKLGCFAKNNAIGADGQARASETRTWTLSIRQPSLSSASFSGAVKGLRCRRRRERVRIPPHWVIGRSHGRRVRIRLPGETRTFTVVRCRRPQGSRGPRETTRRVPHGAPALISGWLGTARGTALGHQRVRILTAPDDGHLLYTQAGVVTTSANGTWRARLRPGPSRLVKAQFDGTSTVEPSASAPIRLVVPASATLDVSPHRTHWGGTIAIDGRLHGGYIPPAGELVVLWIGWPGGSAEIGHLYTRKDGRFRSTYTFLRGNGTETYRLWAATARETDYPYGPARSPKTPVTVGP